MKIIITLYSLTNSYLATGRLNFFVSTCVFRPLVLAFSILFLSWRFFMEGEERAGREEATENERSTL